MTVDLKKLPEALARSRRPVGWIVTGVLAASAVTAVAVQDSRSLSATSASADCNDFKSAADAAVKNHVLITTTFMDKAAASMQAAVSPEATDSPGSANSGLLKSCLGDLSLLDFDISGVIPDFGILSNLLGRVVDKMVGKVCNSVRNSVQTAVGSWNSTVATINGSINLNGQLQDWASGTEVRIDSSINGYSNGTIGPVRTDIPGASNGQRQCIQTLNGQVCTDGSTSTSGGLLGGGGTSGSASYIGAEFARQVESCNAAIQQHRMLLGNSESGTGPGNMGIVNAQCGSLQNFVYANAPYIAPGTVPTYPEFAITSPSNLGTGLNQVSAATTSSSSAGGVSGGSAFSLPVRP